MKQFVRSLYSVALASIVLVGCSKDPSEPGTVPPGGRSREISFTTNIDRPAGIPSSRVNGTQWEYGDELGIYMLWDNGSITNESDIVLDRYNCRFLINTSTGAYNAYDASQAMYLPLENPDNKSFDFFAYHPYTAKKDMRNEYEIPVDITKNKPVMTAKGESDWYDYTQVGVKVPPVNLTFQHKMARIKLNIEGGEGFKDKDLRNLTVTFKSANATGYYDLVNDKFLDMKVADVAFRVTKNQATATTPGTAQEEPGETPEDPGKAGIGSTATLIMIPNTENITYRSIVFKVGNSDQTAPNEETYELALPIADDTKYAGGKEYIYNIILTRKEAKFKDFAIEDWVPGPEMTVEEGDVEDAGTRTFRRSVYNPNCYKLLMDASGGGTYTKTLRIPLMKAYSMWVYDPMLKNSGIAPIIEGTPLKAEIIWADDTDVQYYTLSFSDAKPTRSTNLNIAFSKPVASGQFPNAVNMLVGVRAAQVNPADSTVLTGPDGKTLYEDFYRWSWHVWVMQKPVQDPDKDVYFKPFDHDGVNDGALIRPTDTDYNPNGPAVQRRTSIDYTYYSRILGARAQDEAMGAQTGYPSTGLYYQWGRPTPFPGMTSLVDGSNTYATLYTVNELGELVTLTPDEFGLLKVVDQQQSDVVEVVKDPTIFVASNTGNWIDPSINSQLWTDEAQKSPWDPCPEGWRIPAYQNRTYPNDPEKLLSPWNYYKAPEATDTTTYKSSFNTTYKGFDFEISSNPLTEYVLGWYPAGGYRDAATGEMKEFAIEGRYWSSTRRNGETTYFRFHETLIDPYAKEADKTANAYQIRCVKI